MPLLASHLYAIFVPVALLLYLATCDSIARICPLVSPLTSTGRPPAATLSNSSLTGDFRFRLLCSGSNFSYSSHVASLTVNSAGNPLTSCPGAAARGFTVARGVRPTGWLTPRRVEPGPHLKAPSARVLGGVWGTRGRARSSPAGPGHRFTAPPATPSPGLPGRYGSLPASPSNPARGALGTAPPMGVEDTPTPGTHPGGSIY